MTGYSLPLELLFFSVEFMKSTPNLDVNRLTEKKNFVITIINFILTGL